MFYPVSHWLLNSVKLQQMCKFQLTTAFQFLLTAIACQELTNLAGINGALANQHPPCGQATHHCPEAGTNIGDWTAVGACNAPSAVRALVWLLSRPL